MVGSIFNIDSYTDPVSVSLESSKEIKHEEILQDRMC